MEKAKKGYYGTYLGLWIESKTLGQIRRHKQTYRMRKRNIQRVLKKKSLSYKLALKLKYGLLSRFLKY